MPWPGGGGGQKKGPNSAFSCYINFYENCYVNCHLLQRSKNRREFKVIIIVQFFTCFFLQGKYVTSFWWWPRLYSCGILLFLPWSFPLRLNVLLLSAYDVLRVFTLRSLRVHCAKCVYRTLKGLRKVSVEAHVTHHCVYTAIMCDAWARQLQLVTAEDRPALLRRPRIFLVCLYQNIESRSVN